MSRTFYTSNIQQAALAFAMSAMLAGCGAGLEPAPELEGGAMRSTQGLELDGGEEGEMVLKTRSRYFSSLEAFAEYAAEHLGATVVRDEQDEVVRVQGSTFVSGKLVFEDVETGQVYEDDDLIRGLLGGSQGRFVIGDQTVERSSLPEEIGITTSALIPSSAEGCTSNGADCIRGETWQNNYLLYSSVGSKTTQSKGGYSTISYQCCHSGEMVTINGQQRCRYYPDAVYEFDPVLRKPIMISQGPPAYRTPDTCSYQALRNSLEMNVRRYFGPHSSDWETRTATNKSEAKWSEWSVPANSFGITTLCGFHNGSRGSPVQTAKGFTGDGDLLCNGN